MRETYIENPELPGLKFELRSWIGGEGEGQNKDHHEEEGLAEGLKKVEPLQPTLSEPLPSEPSEPY